MPIVRSRQQVFKTSPIDNENGLVGWWSFDDGQAGDSSGNGNVGSLVGTTLPRPTGSAIPGLALLLDGSTSNVSVPDSTSLATGDTFTLSIWCKRGATGTQQCLMSKGVGGFYFGFLALNKFEMGKSGVANIATSTNTVTDTAGWHHYCATKNGSTSKLYFDGADVTGAVVNSTVTDVASPISIGTDPGFGLFLNGSLDDPRLYKRALTPDEVNSIYNQGIAGFSLSPDEWQMPILSNSTPPSSTKGSWLVLWRRRGRR